MSSESKLPQTCPNGSDNCPIYNEVEQLRKEVVELRTQVTHDYLTGLFNLRHLLFALEQEFERTSRSRQPTSLIMLDIDHFKKVNDTHGHVVGDIALKHIAGLLGSCVRKLDICCRYGGEEFCIILPSTHHLVGVQVAERIRQNIEQAVIQANDVELKLTASFGVGTFLYSTNENPTAFIERVDKQLYKAKRAGRNAVVSTSEDQTKSSQVSTEERDALFPDGTDKDE